MIEKINWYKSWFNSPFYPILYHNRDVRDARVLLDNLLKYLRPAKSARFLDLACGRGRHSIYLNAKGYAVTGIDMSRSSIEEARKHVRPGLDFQVGDMRHIPYSREFDYVINLFTSFGYFEDPRDNITTLKAVRKSLKPGGSFVLDFFNTPRVIKELIEEEEKEIEGINFHITRSCSDGYIRKQIAFEHDGRDFYFEERVEAFMEEDFQRLIKESGMTVKAVFGDYHLSPYNSEHSERIIFIATK
jgi:SAM-dependent methyltransferase